MTTKEPSNIYEAMNAVMKAEGYVQKTGKAGYGGSSYSYAGEGDLIKAIRPHCVENGIVIHPLEVQQIHQDIYETSKGNAMNRTAVVITYRFAHAPSYTHFDVTVSGEGADVGDKSSNKAMTSAFKYALRQSFMIETGDDPDKMPSQPQEEPQHQNGKPKLPDPPKPTPAMQKKFHATGKELYGDEWDDKRPEFVEAISKRRNGGKGPAVTSSKDLFRAEMQHLIDGMNEKLSDQAELADQAEEA